MLQFRGHQVKKDAGKIGRRVGSVSCRGRRENGVRIKLTRFWISWNTAGLEKAG